VAAGWPRDYVPEATALVFLAVTVFLLIHDLGRPERFWHLLLKPNTKSWLVKGGWVLTGFGALAAASLVARWMKMDDVADALRWVNVPLAVMASGYSAFLFAQCRGRDLWIKRTWALGAILILKAVVLGLCFAALFPWRPDEKLAPALVRFLCISGPLCWAWIALVIAEICYERRFNLKDVTHVGSMLAALAVVLFLPIVGTPLVVAHQLFFERRWVREGQEPLIS
jgi:formate-dependent nitrite reductase membrane component NrfD